MQISSQHRLFLSSILLIIGIFTAIELALKAPILDVKISMDTQTQQILISPKSLPTQALFADNSHLESIAGVPVRAALLIEEPDQLPTWAAYNQFMSEMAIIYQASLQGQVLAVVSGKTVVLPVRDRSVLDLPGLFWLQVVIAGLAFLIAAGVYAFKKQNAGAQQFFFAGFALGVSALSASVYSSREFILDGDWILMLSISNQLGAVFFTVALVALMAHYPKKLFHQFWVMPSILLAGLFSWLGFSLQLYPNPSGVYMATLVLFSMSFILAYSQWQLTRNMPVERASLKWYLLSIYLGTGLFAVFILIPVSLGIPAPTSQGVMFLVFLLMFIGIALGIIRYRLFDLDRWWFAAWGWFLGGLFLITLDALFIFGIGLNTETALVISLAVIGWLYFPARQWIMTKLFKSNEKQNDQLNLLIKRLFSAQNAEDLNRVWQNTLAETWHTLSVDEVTDKLNKSQITKDGQQLELPSLRDDKHLIFTHPNQGSRLFNKHDLETAELFYQIGQQALVGLKIRRQTIEEKNRIFSDLHDDVGAKLLSLLYKTADPDLNQITRSALQDLREIVSQPDASSANLNNQMQHWQQEMRLRLQDSKVKLHWTQNTIPNQMVSTLTLNHIMRILREATNNILKHAQSTEVWIDLHLTETNELQIGIKDNGLTQDPKEWVLGRGTRNIRHRSELLNGSATWYKVEPQGCHLILNLPLLPPSLER